MAGEEVRQSLATKPGFFYGYIVVTAAFFIMVVIWGTYNAFGIFFKPVLTEFGWTRAMTSGAFSLSMIVHGLLGVLMGRLNDRLGSRLVMTLCGFLLGIGYLLMSRISDVWQLYLFYGVIIGTGMAGAFVPLMSTVARWFVRRRSMMTGIVSAGAGIGTLIAPPVASRLISSYEWRMAYIILGGVVLVIVILAAQYLRRNPVQVAQRPRGDGGVSEPGLKSEMESFSLKAAMHTKQFWLVCVMVFLFGFGAFAITVHIAPHATELGISAASAAGILATFGGFSVFGRVVLGGAGDRFGNRQAFIIGFILMAAALFWLVPATEAWALYLFAAVFGIAYGGCTASESPLVAVLFGLSSHGLILGVVALSFTAGAAVGPFVAGYIFDATGSYRIAFLVCGAISIVALILAMALTPLGRTKRAVWDETAKAYLNSDTLSRN